MANVNSNVPDIKKEIPSAGSARIHLEVIKENLNQIHAVVCTAKYAEESKDDDNRDLVLISLFGLIENLASDWSSVHPLADFLEAATEAEAAAYNASKGVACKDDYHV